MKISELITAMQAQLTEINNRYPNFMNYIQKRYGRFESRYPADVFSDLFISLIVNNQAELAFAETLARETNTSIAADKLGTINKSSGSSKRNSTSDNTTSYKGYNVEGEFSKYNTIGDATGTTESTNSQVNYFSYLAGINQNVFSDTFKNIIYNFEKLVVTIYPLD